MEIESPAPEAARHSGAAASVRNILEAAGRYAAARTKLFLLEGRYAARESARLVLFFALAATVGLFGGLLLTAALVLWIAQQWMNGNHAAACVLCGLTFLIVAAFLFRQARRCLQARSFFPVSIAELQHDKPCL